MEYARIEITQSFVDAEPRVHKGVAREDGAGLLAEVAFFGVESLEADVVEIVDAASHNDVGDERFALVLRNVAPRASRSVLPGGDEAVKLAVVDDVVILAVFVALCLYNLLFLVGQLGKVKLVAESTRHRDVAAGLEGRDSCRLMVRASRNVRAYCRGGVAHRGAVLNFKSLDRVGIVARPELRRIVEPSGVESTATARATLEKKMRICGEKSLEELVKSEDVAVEDLLLTLRADGRASDLGQAAVEVPLDIRDIRAVHNLFDAIKEIIPDVRACHIENVLMARDAHRSIGGLNCPIGVRAEELAVPRHHFGLEPDTEFESDTFDPLDELAKSALELFLVDEPITERGTVRISVAKPAVVHNEHLNAELGRGFCYIEELFFVEIEVGRLPVVDEDGTALIFPLAAAEIVSVKLMECAAHTAESRVRIDHHRLGSDEVFARFKTPIEALGIDTDQHARAAVGIHICGCKEIARVNEVEAVNVAKVLGSVVRGERDEGVVHMRGASHLARNALRTVDEGHSLESALLRPASVEVDEIHIPRVVEINARAEHALNIHNLIGRILNDRVAGHCREVFKNGIEKSDLGKAHRVDTGDLERGRLVIGGISRGLTLDLRLARIDFVRNVLYIGVRRARVAQDRQRTRAEIAATVRGILHSVQRFAEKGYVTALHLHAREMRGVATAVVEVFKRVIRDLRAVIIVHKIAVTVDPDDVARRICIKLEGFVFGIEFY